MMKLYNFFSSAMDFVILFMKNSSIHGFNQITTRERHISEYILWIVALISAGTATIQLSLSKWHRYQENPTVVSMEKNYLQWNTTLPAVSICPESKYNERNLENVIYNEFPYVKDKASLKGFLISLVNTSFKNFNVFEEKHVELKTNDYWKAVNLIQRQFIYNVFNTNPDNYESKEMQPFMSESGICYSYNALVTQYNSPSYWSSNNRTIVKARTEMRGTPLDGDVFAQITNMDTDYELFIHEPAEFPDAALRSLFCTNNTFKELDVQALTIYSTEATQQLSMKQRKCRLPEESNLQLSPVYTYNMCRMECRMKKSHELCGCIPYFYRPLENYKVCDIKGMQCLDYNKEFLIKLRDPKTEQKVPCNCLPQCNEVNYLIDREHDMEWTFGTTLKVGLVKYPKVRYKRDILFGFTDLLVGIGGTAGLFLGCSLLSFAEIFYFFTLRLFWFIFKRKRSNKVK